MQLEETGKMKLMLDDDQFYSAFDELYMTFYNFRVAENVWWLRVSVQCAHQDGEWRESEEADVRDVGVAVFRSHPVNFGNVSIMHNAIFYPTIESKLLF